MIQACRLEKMEKSFGESTEEGTGRSVAKSGECESRCLGIGNSGP